jgi:Putative transposase/Transposase zinc-binding domain
VVELAEIFRQYGPAYRAKFGERLLPSHRQVMWAIEHCRTEALGGHVYQCPDCDTRVYQYHSCRNRHCPKCQNENAQHWLEQQGALLLPVPYFMLTFTLPAPLRPVARRQQALLYDLLFRTSASATQHLAAEPRFIGGQLGLVGVLHTWGRTLTYHPHVHYLIPAGGLTDDGQTWRPARDDFLVPVKALAGIFRARFRDALRSTTLFGLVPAAVWEHDWVVHCKAVGNGETAFKYLAPYIFRVAISNRRLLKVENDHVTFRYRASDSGQTKLCTLAVEEFIHRFLQHVLPKGFVKVRYYGFLSVAQRAQLTPLRQQLAPDVTLPLPTSALDLTDDQPTSCADSCATPVTPVATNVPSLAPLTPSTPADLAVNSTVTAASGTADQQAAMISPPSSSSTPPREVPRGGCALRCPVCGRLLLRGAVLFPTPGHPP